MLLVQRLGHNVRPELGVLFQNGPPVIKYFLIEILMHQEVLSAYVK